MLGCTTGKIFQVTVGGGSYQEGLLTHLQGVPAGMYVDEKEIYAEMLQRKPGQGELSSPRREPDIPIIYTGVNAADTMEGVKNKGYTNGTPLTILIPNLDRHFEHIEQYRTTNRTPRPGHASFASYQKYGKWDDAIGAGIFSGRATATVVAAGSIARQVLKDHGIEICAYVREAAGIKMPDAVSAEEARKKVLAFKKFRSDMDPVYDLVYKQERVTPEMRFLEKMAALAEVEKMVPEIKRPTIDDSQIEELKEQGIHPVLNCPHLESAEAMYDKIISTRDEGDSSGGVVEVVAMGVPAGLGEPLFAKLDAELGRMLGIGAIKGVEVGAGFQSARMMGSDCNDQMKEHNGEVQFTSNNSGGITGGLTTGQNIVARLAVKPTPTIAKPQQTVDKITKEDAQLAAVTRRDPTIVSRVWPVAEAYTALILLDHLYMQYGYNAIAEPYAE